jgi:minor histocompatibility antigen H13
VKVATSLDIPIKLLWPKSLTFSDARGYTMLGLGDVVIPGIFIGLCLRWDFHRSRNTTSGGSFSKPYFYTSLIGYIAGLVTTMLVMHIFGKAQPALLYLRYVCEAECCTWIDILVQPSMHHITACYCNCPR